MRERYPVPIDVDMGDPDLALEQLGEKLDQMCLTEQQRALEAIWWQLADDPDAKRHQHSHVLLRKRRLAEVRKKGATHSIVASHRVRAAVRGVLNTLTNEEWSEILRSHDGMCAYCGSQSESLTLDHLIPVSQGGANAASNVVACCRFCNTSKSAQSLVDWAEKKNLNLDRIFERIERTRKARCASKRR